jgi:hypothetical protein
MMADDASLETQISAITDQLKILLKKRNKLKLLDMAKYNRLQKKMVLRRLKWISDGLKLALAANGGILRFSWCFRGEKPAWQSVSTVNEPLFSL